MTVQDSIELSYVAPAGSTHESLLVFFITGNPGLIEYYRTFLTLCFDSLRTKYSNHHIKVAGTSLRGFGVQDGKHQHPVNDNAQGPYDLEQQIEHIGQMLERAIEGHATQDRPTKQLSNDARVIGGICLFPTVTHIAKSPSGKKFSFFFAIPYFAVVAGFVVRLLFSWVPFTALQNLVGLVTGFPASAAETTTAFIKSRGGVRQALQVRYLAGHEMKTITTDAWDDELWGISKSQNSNNNKTKLYFYFGTDDHWVANETRDELIAARAATGKVGEEDKPPMEVDTHGTPHGFCIKHNDLVAKKVEQYIGELMQSIA
ncbi:hypothetical protein KCU83_g6088, partial [Aureobasidium melanogenum]